MSVDFEKAFGGAGEIAFDKFKFEEPDYDMLQFDEESYLEHLKVQAAGLAYYGTLAKTAERECEDLEKRYKMWYNGVYSDCSDIIARAGKKNGVKDIDALVQCKFEDKIKEWENALKKARMEKDNAQMWYEAWKAKGFALSSMTNLITAGLLTPKTSITEDDMNQMSINRARRIISSFPK